MLLPDLSGMFCEPAWDMLLDLFTAAVRGKSVAVLSACLATGAATSTALRWLVRLERHDAVFRVPDPNDARRTYVHLRPATFESVRAWLQAFHRNCGMIGADGRPTESPRSDKRDRQ